MNEENETHKCGWCDKATESEGAHPACIKKNSAKILASELQVETRKAELQAQYPNASAHDITMVAEGLASENKLSKI